MPLLPAFGPTPGSLFVCLGLCALITAVFAANASRGMPGFERPLRLWAAALLCVALAAAGVLARSLLPGPLSYVVPNLAMLSAVATMGLSFAVLEGGHLRRARWSWCLVLLTMAALLGAEAWHAPYAVLAGVGALGLGLLLLHGAVLFLPQLRVRPRGRPEAWVLASLLVAAASFVVRAASTATDVWSPDGPLYAHPMLVVGLVFVSSCSLAFFCMLHERQRVALQQTYQRDSLTGLYARGVFFEKAQAALQMANVGDVFAVVMLDLDHFKRINDTHGHLVGDKVIAHAARLLNGSVRLGDLAGRYGGEEFCLLLHDCDAERAGRFLQRVLLRTEQPLSLRDGRSLPFSFSVGFVIFRMEDKAPPLEQLLDRADQALLQAKAQGRNRAVQALGCSAGMYTPV
ncbi:GGDEF domain-containing protein [Pseudorhodoferax soli]|uniref:diguanylate cyclase n=1 Tax=Pseudorhodoferax soli TaxID=545864 RepID=A0A368Y8H9_9BURK|nr:GGDEF domain-containing protein [Pseudorhodoferax soli]RCW74504.1 diguanylate cyclase (GGDEF)-like protein [Pseudorhodoferax soli]